METPKLPNKWAVKRTCENSKILNDWNNNHPLFYEHRRSNATEICNDDYFYNDKGHSANCRPGYIEITFEQFLEHVLKQNVEIKSDRLLFILKFIKDYGIKNRA